MGRISRNTILTGVNSCLIQSERRARDYLSWRLRSAPRFCPRGRCWLNSPVKHLRVISLNILIFPRAPNSDKFRPRTSARRPRLVVHEAGFYIPWGGNKELTRDSCFLFSYNFMIVLLFSFFFSLILDSIMCTNVWACFYIMYRTHLGEVHLSFVLHSFIPELAFVFIYQPDRGVLLSGDLSTWPQPRLTHEGPQSALRRPLIESKCEGPL